MAKKQKFYIGQINTRNGEYEYETTVKFRTGGSPDRYLRRIASTFYDDEGGELQDGKDGAYYFNGGEVACSEGDNQEISEAAFNELTMLTEM